MHQYFIAIWAYPQIVFLPPHQNKKEWWRRALRTQALKWIRHVAAQRMSQSQLDAGGLSLASAFIIVKGRPINKPPSLQGLQQKRHTDDSRHAFAWNTQRQYLFAQTPFGQPSFGLLPFICRVNWSSQTTYISKKAVAVVTN